MKSQNRILKIVFFLLLTICGATTFAQGPYPKTGDMTVCLNATEPYGVVLNTGSSYSWSITPVSGGNGTISPGATPNLISVSWTSVGTANLQVIETNAQGCASNPVIILVTVNALPTATITANNSPICSGANATFTITGTSGAIVTYNINGGASQTITLTGGTATVTVTAATVNQTLNLVSVNNPSGGCSQTLSATSTVTVNPALTANITANNSPICSGADATFTITGTSGAVVTYSINGAANQTITLTSGTATVTEPSATANQTLTLVSVSSAGGCTQTLSGTSTVIVNPKPTATVTSNNSPICPGADAVFTLGGTPGAIVTYNINGGASQTITLTGGTATVTVTAATVNQTLNLVSVNNTSGGCSQTLSATSTVTVNPALTASITANNSPICAGASATFTLSGSSGAVVTYNINGGANQTVTLTGGTATVTVTAATANQTLNLVSINSPSGGCSQTLSGSSTVTVTPKPVTSPITHN